MAQYYLNRINRLEDECYLYVNISEKSERQIKDAIPYLKRIPLLNYHDVYEWSINVQFTRISCGDEWLTQLKVFAEPEGLRYEEEMDDRFRGVSITPYGENEYTVTFLPLDVEIMLEILEQNGDISDHDPHNIHLGCLDNPWDRDSDVESDEDILTAIAA